MISHVLTQRRAILIGVDGYTFKPLTSAVNDAIAMRDALVSRTSTLEPIFDEKDVVLLVTPQTGGSPIPSAVQATRDNIVTELRAQYECEDPISFLFVYFAGHGLTASPDGRVRETIILPSDVTEPEDGRNMISLTELLSLFSERGPRQQVWIVDACRDMPYNRQSARLWPGSGW